MSSPPQFSSKDEECEYWKKKAEQLTKELEETKEELEDFQSSSRELEEELETQLKMEEKRNKEMTALNSRLTNECDTLKEKIQTQHADSHKRVSDLEESNAKLTASKHEQLKYIRELEQDNDDLERAQRATISSIEDFEHRLNEAIERNAILESELDDKEVLMETVQRLKDESRDLKQEIDVGRRSRDVTTPPTEEEGTSKPMVDSGYSVNSAPAVSPTTPTTPMNRVPHTPSLGSNSNNGTSTPLTPSARISALNIVGDLLRKVGALESKLATCKNFVKDDSNNTNKPPASPLHSPRSKRLNRGSSSLPVQQNLKLLASVK